MSQVVYINHKSLKEELEMRHRLILAAIQSLKKIHPLSSAEEEKHEYTHDINELLADLFLVKNRLQEKLSEMQKKDCP